jgi:hypothetical protein
MKKVVYFAAIAVCLFCSCEEKCHLPNQIIGKGEIVDNALIPHIDELRHSYGKEGYIINSEEENTFDITVSYDNGKTFEPIDFNRFTALGKHVSGTCSVVFERNVTRNDALKTYIYTIDVWQCGNCEKRNASMNWVLVPKIPDDYTVKFVVNELK